jgi:hypothetical protein
MAEKLIMFFPDHMERLRALRKTDAGFNEICEHFEIMLVEANNCFGEIDSSTAY